MVYLRGMPGLEISIHSLVGEDKLAPTQSRHCQQWAPTPAQKRGFAPPGGHVFKLQALPGGEGPAHSVPRILGSEDRTDALTVPQGPALVCESSAGPLRPARHQEAPERPLLQGGFNGTQGLLRHVPGIGGDAALLHFIPDPWKDTLRNHLAGGASFLHSACLWTWE